MLRQVRRPLRLDALLQLLDLSRRDKEALKLRLNALESEGRIVRLPGGKWTDAGQARLLCGVLSVQRSGAGFVTPERASGRGQAPADIFIHPAFLGEARHGDRVQVAPVPGRRGSHAQGRVVAVLERGAPEITVQVERISAGILLCRPVDARFPFRVEADAAALPTPPRQGELLVVRPERQSAPGVWRAEVLRALGCEDDVTVQEQLVRINHGIPFEFPPAVEAEVRALEERTGADELDPVLSAVSAAQRQDLRGLPFVTVDDEDARDFDDAICVLEAPGGGTTLWVAVADVSLYVRAGSAVDREAGERGNSYYFPASVTPMLPERLSNDLCSLLPGKERPVMAVRIVFDTEGRSRSSVFFPGLIRSRARLTYKQVHRALEAGELSALNGAAALLPMLHKAYGLAELLRRNRLQRGSLDFDVPEARFVMDEEKRVRDVCCRERFFAHRLIEEFMLAANEAAARFLTERGAAFPYRVHPEPDPERTEALLRTLAAAGLAEASEKPSAAMLRGVLDANRATESEFPVSRMVLRAMMQARYAPEQGPHFGLASPCYCHFTSPIRRYADVLTHRALKQALGVPGYASLRGRKLPVACDRCNNRERAARDAEREITRRLGCLLLRDRIGETFAGVVSGVNEFGFFVELRAKPLEGMVRLDSLEDWFVYDAERQELLGEHTGRRFRLGQPITVRLSDVHVGRLEITFVPAAKDIGRSGGKKRPGRRKFRARSAFPERPLTVGRASRR